MPAMNLTRSSGILLHPTSLPGPYGIGDIGPAAHRWLDDLAAAECRLWQVLPLCPTGYADSPYQCFSTFAGNPYLISPDLLLEEGLVTSDDLAGCPDFPEERVDYGGVISWKLALLDTALDRFQVAGSRQFRKEFETFRVSNREWLDDFALFMALKDLYNLKPWTRWPAPLRDRDSLQLQKARAAYAPEVARHAFRQFLFFRQWRALREHADELAVKIIGDLPIFVAHDSADVWANAELFYLDDAGHPSVVAGVPPDYFSGTGQLWGNPLYRWDVHAGTDYAWWLARFRAAFKLVDVVRVDHFRGFVDYWEIPGDATTAIEGRWLQGPGAPFLKAVINELGDLPIIAEDLGEINPEVFVLRDQFDLPGMKILQFAFDEGLENEFLPHNYPANCIVYTGTHDNDTTLGWWESATQEERELARDYLGITGEDISWDLIRAAWKSKANVAISPLQDVLSLPTGARMNFPGTLGSNWGWRMREGAFSPELQAALAALNRQNLR
jgi:4-alpha-glucanotransferase